MSLKIISTVILTGMSGILFSQSVSDYSPSKKSVFYLSLNFGGNFISDNINSTGILTGIDLSNLPEKNIGYFVNAATLQNYLSSKKYVFDNSSLNNFTVTAGARIYALNKKIFFDLGTGYYHTESSRKPSFSVDADESGIFGIKSYNDNFGLNAGFGGRIRIDDSYGIVISGKFHNIFPVDSRDFFQSVTLTAGLEMNNKVQGNSSGNNNRISTGIFAGSSGDLKNKSSIKLGAEFTYKISESISFVADYSGSSISESDYRGFSTMAQQSERDYSAGIRNYFGESVMRFFAECLADLNVNRETKFDPIAGDYETIVKNSIGLSFGSGAETQLSGNLDGFIKFNLIFLDDNRSHFGMFGGLKYKL
ncbi:MAG TPA: hypothetical protein PKC58_17360 [Ignavibacteria bacterium]|nr:hypothetical protein [Ignavibacteria bacterium]